MQTSNRVFALIPCSLAWPKTLANRGGNGAQLRYIEAFNISSHVYINAAGRSRRATRNYPAGSTRRLSAGSPKVSLPNIARTPTADPGEFCGQTAGAEFPGYAGKIDCQGELNRLRTIDHRRVAID